MLKLFTALLIILEFSNNCFNVAKLFSDLYLFKFLDTLAIPFFLYAAKL